MKVYDAASIRNVALVGHSGAGKTQLVSALLFDAGAVNRLGRGRASLDRSLESLRGVFGRTVIPIHLPIGEEKSFKGIVDLVTMRAWTFAADGSGKATEGEVPGELASAAGTAREALIEMVAEADDALMEKFFDAGTLTQEELGAGLKRGIAAGRVFPVLCASAGANIGMPPILDAVVTYVPSPLEIGRASCRERV